MPSQGMEGLAVGAGSEVEVRMDELLSNTDLQKAAVVYAETSESIYATYCRNQRLTSRHEEHRKRVFCV
jgi:hypothetical protein